MVPKERAKAVGSQPTGPGEDQVGGAHGDENGATGTAPVSMAAGGPGSPPGARKGHMEMRPDQGLLKEGQGVPRGGVTARAVKEDEDPDVGSDPGGMP